MKQVDPKIYNKNYYLNVCFGSEEFNKTRGKKLSPRWEQIINLINIKKGMRILDLGCGRGDAVFFIARKGATVVGIDYSRDGISLAEASLSKMPKQVKQLTAFINIDAKEMDFEDNYFDAVIAIDFFEHLYKDELEVVMEKLSKMLKKNGKLLIHTETNRIYLDFTHKFYVYPVSQAILWIYNKITEKSYPGFPKYPRNEFHKKQHVNEPTIFYLKRLFRKYTFEGKITQRVGLYKPILSWKDRIFNVIVCLYPFSNFFPLNILFATEYICIVKNNKQ